MSENPNNINKPTKECSDCKLHVVREFAKYHVAFANPGSSKKRRKFADETGRLWHGTRCPACATKWRKDLADKAAAETKAELLKKLEE